MLLRHKVPLAFAAVIVVTVGASLLSSHQLNRANEVYAKVIEIDAGNNQHVGDMLVAFKSQVQEWKDTLLRGKDPAKLDKYWSAFQTREHAVDEDAQNLIAALPDGEAKDLVSQFAAAHTTMGQRYREGFEKFKAANFEPSAGDAAVAGMDREPTTFLEKARAKIAANTADSVAAAMATSQHAQTLGWALMGVAGAASILGGVLFGRALVLPLTEAVAVAESVASGDLTAKFVASRTDEIGQLLHALERMNGSLLKMVQEVRNAADSIAIGSAEIAAGSADLSRRTEDESANLQKTASAMEELTATVRQNADTAQTASQLATNATAVATRGGEVVGQVVATMGDISASSKKIVDIIGVIDSIAFQTNILALNAAVEAARAGEQGRGFAVVASEVRSLAQRSAQAAKEIKTLISESVGKVESGAQLVDNAGQTMGDIVKQIKRVEDLIGEISSASAEQSTGIDQIGGAVNELDHAIQQNAALVEESAAAADSLKQQAHLLTKVTGAFKIAT